MHLKSSFPTSLYTQPHTHTPPRVAWAAVSQLRRKSQPTDLELILKKRINHFNSTSSDLSTVVMQKDHKRKKRGEEHVCVFSNCISAIVKLILWHLNLWGKTILTEKHEELNLFKECCSVYKSDFFLVVLEDTLTCKRKQNGRCLLIPSQETHLSSLSYRLGNFHLQRKLSLDR